VGVQAEWYKQFVESSGSSIQTGTIKHPLKTSDDGIVTAAIQVKTHSGTDSFTFQIRYYYRNLSHLDGNDVFSDWFDLVNYAGNNQITNVGTDGKVFVSRITDQPEFDQCDGFEIKVTRSSGTGLTVNIQIMGR